MKLSKGFKIVLIVLLVLGCSLFVTTKLLYSDATLKVGFYTIHPYTVTDHENGIIYKYKGNTWLVWRDKNNPYLQSAGKYIKYIEEPSTDITIIKLPHLKFLDPVAIERRRIANAQIN